MSQGPPSAALVARVRDALDVIANAHGCDLEEVEITKAGSRSKLTVALDRDGGVDLDTIAEISREISERLDQLDVLLGAYTLDVGSRGVHRPLVEPRHWQRALNRLVKAELSDGSSVTGRLTAVGDGEVSLQPQADPRFHSTKVKPPIQVPMNAVRLAVVEVDFRALPPDLDDDDDLDDGVDDLDDFDDSEEGSA